MKRFFNLKFGDRILVGDFLYQKETFFEAVRCYGPRADGNAAPLYRRFHPWSKVQEITSPLQEIMVREAHRFGRQVMQTVSRSSPFIDLMTRGVFPKGVRSPFTSPPPLGARRGKISREVYEWSKGISSDPRNYGERTGPSA